TNFVALSLSTGGDRVLDPSSAMALSILSSSTSKSVSWSIFQPQLQITRPVSQTRPITRAPPNTESREEIPYHSSRDWVAFWAQSPLHPTTTDRSAIRDDISCR